MSPHNPPNVIDADHGQQLPLFDSPDPPGADAAPVTPADQLHPGSLLTQARLLFVAYLAESGRPANTVKSYGYDLGKLEAITGPRRIDRITGQHIARYLAEASSQTTRKRRLTSARQFFAWLITSCKALEYDPTDAYQSSPIRTAAPTPLSGAEATALMDAAQHDEPWSAVAIWLMLYAGLTRAELLALERDHIDRTNSEQPRIHVYYSAAKSGKERTITGNASFTPIYATFLQQRDPAGRLFPIGRPAVNGMVERVRRAAGIGRVITPQMLRHTWAIRQAATGADVPTLLAALGLADDPRNRETVRRYIRIAADDVPGEDLA